MKKSTNVGTLWLNDTNPADLGVMAVIIETLFACSIAAPIAWNTREIRRKLNSGNVRVSQLLGVIIIMVAIGLSIYRRKTGKANVRYSDPIFSSKTKGTVVSAEVHLH